MAAIAAHKSGTSKKSFVFRRIRLRALAFKADKTSATVKFGVMADLLIGNFETKGFNVELLCPLEVIEIEFNAHKSRLDSVHKSSDTKL
jgi:hypothetical protein